MAFQAAYFGLYGRIESTYEPAMTKAFLHGRTEAIRTVQPHTVAFQKVGRSAIRFFLFDMALLGQAYFSEQTSPEEKIVALRVACEGHVKLTKECSQGLGQDRHLYALYCLLQRERSPRPLPALFTDPGWGLLGTSILSTSNCGNPALRLFGFGPVAADGFGIGYIIKEEGLSVCASSKHLQTRRFLDTLSSYLEEVRRLVTGIYGRANARPGPWVDHAGTLRCGLFSFLFFFFMIGLGMRRRAIRLRSSPRRRRR